MAEMTIVLSSRIKARIGKVLIGSAQLRISK
jgi:hypothetical protein